MLRQRQQQRLVQKLSPQQIQFIKLLQVPTASLEERIKEELESNPALDMGSVEKEDDPYDLDEQPQETFDDEAFGDSTLLNNVDITDYLRDEGADYSNYGHRDDDQDDEPRHKTVRVERTFQDHLIAQLGMLQLDERQTIIAHQVIGSIDQDGYLRRDPDAIADDLAFNQSLTAGRDEVESIIREIKKFDPPGVASADLQECLLEQLKRLTGRRKAVKDATDILEHFFNEFTKKQYDKIRQRLDLSEKDFKDAIGVILKLSPKPGSAFTPGSLNHFIIPDFFVINNNGNLELTLNARNAPELKVAESYTEMLKAYNAPGKKEKRQKEALLFIKQKIDSARWFIDSIKQRQHTLLITMNAILELQRDFFLRGDESAIKPMILKDVAAITGMDISTVSRVVNSKYVQTEFGIFLLKYFFSEGLLTDSGEEVSTLEVKKILADVVAEEDKSKPYSDEKLMELLAERGYPLARRTVAKYREQLNIPVARLRKKA